MLTAFVFSNLAECTNIHGKVPWWLCRFIGCFSALLLHKCAVAQGVPPYIEICIKLCPWMNGRPQPQKKKAREQAHSSVYWNSCPRFVSPGFSVVLVWQRSWGRGDSFCCGCPAWFVRGSNFSWDWSAERPSGQACFSSTGPNWAVIAASPGALQVSALQTCLMHLAELHIHSSAHFSCSRTRFLGQRRPRWCSRSVRIDYPSRESSLPE